jgi:hypothetical protein
MECRSNAPPFLRDDVLLLLIIDAAADCRFGSPDGEALLCG